MGRTLKDHGLLQLLLAFYCITTSDLLYSPILLLAVDDSFRFVSSYRDQSGAQYWWFDLNLFFTRHNEHVQITEQKHDFDSFKPFVILIQTTSSLPYLTISGT
ncbi:hypothetical protein XENORESO_009644 [Xenotaenia resolanae]|uniref:Secreted protein n=1 Tax=Xenotaenia resolanae TaxID=208358 RepID=A0ABV0W4H5_9TELE